MAIGELSSAKLNPPIGIKPPENPKLRTAKGLEKLILTLKDFIISAQFAVIRLLFGKYEIQNDETKSKIEKAFDKGLIYVLSKIASVDFCKIISSGLNAVRVGESFNPKFPPLSSASPFEKRKWQIQYIAFRIQSSIDDFKAVFGTDIGQDMRLGLRELLTEINLNLDQLRSEEVGISNKEIADNFPQTKIALNFINDAIGRFSTFINKNISQEEVKDVLKAIDDTSDIARGIMALNTPANLISTVDRLTGGNLDEEIKKLEEFLSSRGEPIRFIKYLLKQANSFNSTAKSVLGYITLARTIIKLLLLLIKVFYVIRFWITANPVPAMLTPMGAISTVEDGKNVIDRKGIFNFIARLQQFEALLREIAELAQIMIVGATEIIGKLTLIKLNLESCNPKLAKEIDDVIQETSRNSEQLRRFLDDINNAVQTNNTTFGKYIIAIVTEELADEGIRLKRRYGIARDSNNFIVVQTTPTFASLDQIIINEVKFLLASKGLVKSSVSVLSPEDSIVYENAIAFLGEDNLQFNIDALTNLEIEGIDTKGDIGSFVNNLPGGSSFRKKSREKVAKNNQNLAKNLKNTDPNSKYAKSINPSGS